MRDALGSCRRESRHRYTEGGCAMTDKLDYDTPGVDPELAAERVTPFELNWKADLLLTATKQPRPVIANALAALRGASDWAGVLAYDEFSLVTMAMRPPVWLQRSNEAWA